MLEWPWTARMKLILRVFYKQATIIVCVKRNSCRSNRQGQRFQRWYMVKRVYLLSSLTCSALLMSTSKEHWTITLHSKIRLRWWRGMQIRKRKLSTISYMKRSIRRMLRPLRLRRTVNNNLFLPNMSSHSVLRAKTCNSVQDYTQILLKC
jgi:hypothetical protein